jgi:hypothetical protein
MTTTLQKKERKPYTNHGNAFIFQTASCCELSRSSIRRNFNKVDEKILGK